MSFYQIYRPHSFAEVLGQEQVIAVLKGQAQTGRFHHAYLFFGASGTGKTTTARILASALNCPNLDGTGEPCGNCQSCRLIKEGRHWDVSEIDGARFRGIDDVRELVFKAHLCPMGNRKVYIIDEAHSLTPDAFNVLLKLLEEPPPFCVMALCTTHFEKIPDTISSRCILLPFHPLKSKDIKAKLLHISQKENITLDDKRLEWIAETACGNLRKAENMLEEVAVITQ